MRIELNRRTTRRRGRASALILVFLGGVFLAVGLFLRSVMGPYDGGVSAAGHVVDTVEYYDRSSGTMYRSVVEFTDPATGETYRVTGTAGSSRRPTVGSTREISFPAGEPQGAKVVELTWLPWIFVGIGGILGLFGLILVVTTLVKGAVLIGALIGDDSDEFGTMPGVSPESPPGPAAPGPSTPPPSGSGPSVSGPPTTSLGDMPKSARPPSPFAGRAADPATADRGAATNDAAGPAAQWYPDPADPTRLRWWDGDRWTDHTHPQ